MVVSLNFRSDFSPDFRVGDQWIFVFVVYSLCVIAASLNHGGEAHQNAPNDDESRNYDEDESNWFRSNEMKQNETERNAALIYVRFASIIQSMLVRLVSHKDFRLCH